MSKERTSLKSGEDNYCHLHYGTQNTPGAQHHQNSEEDRCAADQGSRTKKTKRRTDNSKSSSKDVESGRCQKCINRSLNINMEDLTDRHCGSPNCGKSATVGAKILSTAPGSGPSNDYTVLCPCQETCECRQQQVWLTSNWLPQNWHNWHLVRQVAIGLVIGILAVWLLVYLVLHFYYETL